MGTRIVLRKLALFAITLAFFSGLLTLFGYHILQWSEAEKTASFFRESETPASDKPSLNNLPAIEPMNIEHALILKEIAGLSPTHPEASARQYLPDVASHWPQEMDFTVEYGGKEDDLATLPSDAPVSAWVYQLPNEDWALYFVKHSPMPSLVPKNRSLVLSFVRKFGNRVVVDRQFCDPDGSGRLLYFWPSRKNLITIVYWSGVVNEEFLQHYLEKYPSSL